MRSSTSSTWILSGVITLLIVMLFAVPHVQNILATYPRDMDFRLTERSCILPDGSTAELDAYADDKAILEHLRHASIQPNGTAHYTFWPQLGMKCSFAWDVSLLLPYAWRTGTGRVYEARPEQTPTDTCLLNETAWLQRTLYSDPGDMQGRFKRASALADGRLIFSYASTNQQVCLIVWPKA